MLFLLLRQELELGDYFRFMSEIPSEAAERGFYCASCEKHMPAKKKKSKTAPEHQSKFGGGGET